jgi:chromate transporter
MISRTEAFKTWLKIGLLSFGGPAGQIALMHKILVEEKNWVSETRFLHALNYCMLLPGPEAMQLATYIGWLMHRTWGGIVAGVLFILPGFMLMMGLSAIYAAYHEVPFVSAIFFGLKSAVLVLVIEAVIRIGKKSLHNAVLKALAVLSFVAIFFLGVPFPLIILAAALAGFFGSKYAPKIFTLKAHKEAKDGGRESLIDKMIDKGEITHIRPDKAYALKTFIIWMLLWFAPVAACLYALGAENVFTHIGVFFSKMAMVTFGGAYAVLAYVAQQAVENYRWLSPAEMLDGLGLAETTPGPLILVLQYVGYLAAFAKGGHLWGVLGAALAVWVTFVPCFLWIFLGAPYMEQLRGKPALSAALSAITAAVTGVVMNLAVWFALHVLFAGVQAVNWHGVTLYEVSKPDIAAAVLALVAAFCTFRLKWGIPATLGICAALGLAVKVL